MPPPLIGTEAMHVAKYESHTDIGRYAADLVDVKLAERAPIHLTRYETYAIQNQVKNKLYQLTLGVQCTAGSSTRDKSQNIKSATASTFVLAYAGVLADKIFYRFKTALLIC